MLIKQFKISLIVLAIFTVITGILYPAIVTGVAQLLFPEKANGSLLKNDGNILGSELIGQQFSSPVYFWSRPSATTPVPYNAAASSGSNYGPLNPSLLDQVQKRINTLRESNNQTAAIPADLVTASASGLDPHISIAAALYQIRRVAQNRNMDQPAMRVLVDQCIENRLLGFLGEPRVNVLKLNLALDEMYPLRKEQ